MAISPRHTYLSTPLDDCPGFGRRWICVRVSCVLCGSETIAVFACKFRKRGGEIVRLRCECGGRIEHAVIEED